MHEMKTPRSGRALVKEVLTGHPSSRTPVYAWVRENLSAEISAAFGSVEALEDHYAFDLAHLFGGPGPFDQPAIDQLRAQGIEVTPEVALDIPLQPADRMLDYQSVRESLDFYQAQRGRFCYMQTPGIFECLNGLFGIEDHLCYMALYPDAMKEIYRRQAEWNRTFADCVIDLGVDMVHISDDWGAQRGLLFSPDMFRDMIYPAHKIVCDHVRKRGCFLSLHSDGNVNVALDDVVDLGYHALHPWQESAGMSYDRFLSDYADRLTLFGGLCIQTTLGFGNFDRVEQELHRVFTLLKGKRWIFCTTHFVQNHCSIEELTMALDLAVKLAR